MSRLRVTSPVRGVEGTTLFEVVDDMGAPIPGPRAALVGLIHGNEPVGGDTIDRIEPELATALAAGSLLTVRANLEAVKQNRRYTDGGRDINRLFDAANLTRLKNPDERRCYEEHRAVELAPLLLDCEAILDLHSTSRPAPPFVLFRDDQRHATIASRLGVARLVTGLHEAAILDGGLACNIGLAPGDYHPRLGFTFEAGEHSNPENSGRAYDVAVRFLAALGMWQGDLPPNTVRPRVYEVIERFVQVSASQEPWRFVGYTGGEAGGGRHAPPRALASFETVEADEIIVKRGNDSVVRAATPFTMLMPAPTAEAGADLYYVAQRRHGGLGVAENPRTDVEARREAVAIERMLDLLDDDEHERGVTRASFDTRLVFDQCAELITRALRMPDGSPHRRITVVGRGDWGGDEAERRAGQRYRQAFREAVLGGLQIDRVQLMRGASLAWLDALTSSSMRDMLDQRSEVAGAGDIRFWVSAQQPHTVSILVVGDLDKAIREADTRHVRVALVIEAATVEPDGDQAAVRTVRAGLFSSRMEFLRATSRLLTTLRNEHHRLMAQPSMQDAAFRSLLGTDGGIYASTEPGALDAMRGGLRELQLDLWRQQLAPLTQGKAVSIRDDNAVGEWVVRTMAETGIRDVDAIRALVVRDADGYCFDPARALALMQEPAALIQRTSHRGTPPQPLSAHGIGADDLERWVGWKRYLRGAQAVPDTRGKDIDLAFTGSDIHRRIRRVFEHTREMAAQMPGRVLVVIAGDGQSPTRERPTGQGAPVMLAHRAVLLDPRVRYLRIQHAQGTHLSWMKDHLDLIRSRPDGAEPCGLMWEAEHGSSVNVLLVAVRDPEAGPPDPWSLEGWSIEHCAIVMSELEGGSHDYQFGVFTELLPGLEGRINADLLHFGRAHCQGLLAQGGARAFGDEVAAFESAVVAQLASWIHALRACDDDPSQRLPPSGPSRTRWVAETLGLADHRLARVLGLQVDSAGAPEDAAQRIWSSVPMWPGPLWEQLDEKPG